MKINSRFLFAIAFLTLAALSGYAQTELPSESEAFYPDIFRLSSFVSEQVADSLASSSEYGQNIRPKVLKHWVAFSDCDDNITYSSPFDGSDPFSKLAINEEVRIASIKNGYALVYHEPQKDIQYPLISQYAKSRGWVPINRLLLWHNALNTSSGILMKALALVPAEKSGNIAVFSNPENDSYYSAMFNAPHLYFIMKRCGDMSLLATQSSMEGTSSSILVGWFRDDSYYLWNTRMAFEKTWDSYDVENLASEHACISFYSDTLHLQVPVARIKFPSEKYSKDRYQYRTMDDTMRFIDMEGSDDNWYKTILGYSTVWTPKFCNGRSMYKEVAFLSSEEFSAALSSVESLVSKVDTLSRNGVAEELAQISMAVNHSISKDDALQMSYADCMGQVFGIKPQEREWSAAIIGDLSDPKKVTDDIYALLVDNLKGKYEKLSRNKKSVYKYISLIGGIKYYWIPLEDFPY